MNFEFWLEQFPLWGIFCLAIATVLLSVWIGSLLGDRRRRQPDHENESSLGATIGATLGLLAFMLAFTFGMAADRFQTKKQLLLDEVNAIGTTWLRAGLLQEPHRSEVRDLLGQYVEIRANMASRPPQEQLKQFDKIISHSEELQAQLWSHAAAIAKKNRSSEIDALFISSLNEMIDLHNSRVTVASYRIPPIIWYILVFITFFSMITVGYQAGLSGKTSLNMGLVLALTFSAVIFLIADMDRAVGLLRVNQKPLLELQKKLQESVQEKEQKTGALDTPLIDKLIQNS